MALPDTFEQLALRFTDPVQHSYEVIREVVLEDETIAERSRRTGVDRATIAEKARRFIQHGMFGLVDQRVSTVSKDQTYPDEVAGYVLYLKQLYPPIGRREIVRIVQHKFGYKTNHVTVRRFLQRHPIPVQLPLSLTGYHDFETAYRARYAVVKMHYQGWHHKSIAQLLGLSRQHVVNIVVAFERDEFASLEDRRTRPVTHPATQLLLPLLKEVLDVQREYPRAGRFRVKGLLEKKTGQSPSAATIGRAMAINREVHDAPPAWITNRTDPSEPDGIVKYLPFEPTHRHRYWFMDYRYLVRLDDEGHWAYSLCIIEGYSRKILAGMATEYQDSVAVIQLLTAALGTYGKPDGVVSDNGSAFKADIVTGLLTDLGIEALHIEKGKPWEDLIEAQFKIQRRIGDAAFERAADFAEIRQEHEAFIETFNTTAHWAHRDRDDGLRTPEEVLGWVKGEEIDPTALQQAVRHLRVERVVTPRGYVSIQRFYLYAERGLSRRRVSIWLCEGRANIGYQDALLARYAYHYDRPSRRMSAVSEPEIFHTTYASPQLELLELDEDQWQRIYRRPYERRPRLADSGAIQLAFALPA
jgi:putative transposase